MNFSTNNNRVTFFHKMASSTSLSRTSTLFSSHIEKYGQEFFVSWLGVNVKLWFRIKRMDATIIKEMESFCLVDFARKVTLILFCTSRDKHRRKQQSLNKESTSNGKILKNIDSGGDICIPVNILRTSNEFRIILQIIETGFTVVLEVQRAQILNFTMVIFVSGRYVNKLVPRLVINRCLRSNARHAGSFWYRRMVQMVKLKNDKSRIDLWMQNICSVYGNLQDFCSVVSKSKNIDFNYCKAKVIYSVCGKSRRIHAACAELKGSRFVYSKSMEIHSVFCESKENHLMSSDRKKIHPVCCEWKGMRIEHHENGFESRTDGGVNNFNGNSDYCLCKFVNRHDPLNIEGDGDVDKEFNIEGDGDFYQEFYDTSMANDASSKINLTGTYFMKILREGIFDRVPVSNVIHTSVVVNNGQSYASCEWSS